MLLNSANTLLENDQKAIEILSDAFATASAGIAALKTMESVIPQAAKTVETASHKLTSHFMTLTQTIQKRHSEDDEEVLKAIQGITTELQFQDRNTQISQNAVLMMERCREMLESVQQAIGDVLNDPRTRESVAGAVETILSAIRLNDMRMHFKDTLSQMKIDYDDCVPHVVVENLNNDIELF